MGTEEVTGDEPAPLDLQARRILIYGVTGSGKTTLAKRLSERTGLPWQEADQLTWEANWVQVPDEEQRRRIQEICDRDQWILDTAYGKWIDVPLARVELIIGLDYPRWVSLGRLLRRTVARAVDKAPVCNGNVENWRLVFSRESIVMWHFRSFARKRSRIRKWASNPDGPRVIIIRAPSELEGLLSGEWPLEKKPR